MRHVAPDTLRRKSRAEQITAVAVIVLSLAAITIVELFIWPRHNIALLYAVPVIVAADNLGPTSVLLVTGIAAVLTALDAVWGNVPMNLAVLVLLAVMLFGYFVTGAQRSNQ